MFAKKQEGEEMAGLLSVRLWDWNHFAGCIRVRLELRVGERFLLNLCFVG